PPSSLFAGSRERVTGECQGFLIQATSIRARSRVGAARMRRSIVCSPTRMRFGWPGSSRCRRSLSAFKQPYNERQRALLREFREFRDFDDISTVSLAEFELALANL